MPLLPHDDPQSQSPNREFFVAEPPYGDEACPGRYLYEVTTEDFVPSFPDIQQPAYLPMWTATLWDSNDIDTPEECDEIVVTAAVRRERENGDWEDWDAFHIVGVWREACLTVLCGGGKWPDGSLNDATGSPWTWIDIEAVRRVRVAVSAHDQSCAQLPTSIIVGETAL